VRATFACPGKRALSWGALGVGPSIYTTPTMGVIDAPPQPRTELTPTETFFMFLMPVSQAVVWSSLYMVRVGTIDAAVCALVISIFYAVWAVRNYLTGNVRERGMFTFGVTAMGAALEMVVEASWPVYVAVVGCASVAGSCAFVLLTVGPWPLTKLAHVSQKTVLFAGILKAYLTSLALSTSVLGVLLWTTE
jgi:hypothetical protein